MRKRIVAAGLGILCLAAVLLWVLRARPPLGAIRSEEIASAPNNSERVITNREDLTALQQGDAPPVIASGSRGPAPNSVQQWSEEVHRPIEFYGRVVDEHEQPVEGATIGFVWTHFHPEKSFTTNTTTDADGWFSLGGVRGAGLEVRVSKPGYYRSRGTSQNNFFSYSVAGGSEPFRPDPGHPVIYHLRKKGIGADLITSRHGMSPAVEISGLRDGSVARVDFFKRKVDPSGQMEIGATKPAPDEPGTQWSLRLSIPNGGLIEQNEEFPFEAPESGYQSTIEYRFKAGDTNWTERLSKSYYVVFGEPRIYGRIRLETTIRTGIRLEYAINPDGSRNLESAEVKPPGRAFPTGVVERIPDHIKR